MPYACVVLLSFYQYSNRGGICRLFFAVKKEKSCRKRARIYSRITNLPEAAVMKKASLRLLRKKIRKERRTFSQTLRNGRGRNAKRAGDARINTDYTLECIDRRIRATSRYLSKAEECFKIFMLFAKAKDLFSGSIRFRFLPKLMVQKILKRQYRWPRRF